MPRRREKKERKKKLVAAELCAGLVPEVASNEVEPLLAFAEQKASNSTVSLRRR